MPIHMIVDRSNNPQRIKYSPARDIAYSYSGILKRAEQILLDGTWQDLDDSLVDPPYPEDLEAGWLAIALTINDAQCNYIDDFEKLLSKHGWFDVPPGTRLAICAVIGRVAFGAMFAGISESVDPDVEKPMSSDELAALGDKFSRLWSKPNWWRRIKIWRWRRQWAKEMAQRGEKA